MSLREKTISGAKWSAIATVIIIGLGLVQMTVLALTIAALITLVLCMNYLHKQASITTRINHIEDLELKLENLKSENDALQTRIDTYVDLDHVYKVATEELGMVYANKDQILLYDKTESEYVRQYEDIPKH